MKERPIKFVLVKKGRAKTDHLCLWCRKKIYPGEECIRIIGWNPEYPRRFTILFAHIECLRREI